MAVRNFYVSCDIDGRSTLLEGGPRNNAGGMTAKFTQREDGSIVNALTVRCYANPDGSLVLRAYNSADEKVLEYVTRR